MRRLIPVLILALALLAGCGTPTLDPQDREIAGDRAEAVYPAELIRDQVAPPASVIARGSSDVCSSFQRNWKIKDRYAYECWLTRTAVVPVADVGTGLREFHRRAGLALCTGTPGSTLERAIDYWPKFRGREQDGHRYDARDLPSGRYACPGSDTVLELQPASPRQARADLQRELDLPVLLGGTEAAVVERTTIPADATLTGRDEPMLMIVTVAFRYATVDW